MKKHRNSTASIAASDTETHDIKNSMTSLEMACYKMIHSTRAKPTGTKKRQSENGAAKAVMRLWEKLKQD